MSRILAFATSSLLAATALAGADLSGEWEVQSMGADRKIELAHKGKKIVAHRVMWPEFEGEKYKLEHLYRGKIEGDQIEGQLLVKEDELPEFEVLRPFTGRIASNDDIILDGLPMKRTGGAAPAISPEPPPSSDRPSPPPSFAEAAPSQSPDATATDDATSLFANILGAPGKQQDLFLVSNRVTVPNPVADLTDQGDELYTRKEYDAALAKFKAAAEVSKTTHAELLHRMGRCHLMLEEWHEAKRLLRRALRLDPGNARLRRDYERVKDRA